MEEKITVDTILDWLKSQVESKNPVSPHLYIEAAQKLVVLVGDEQDKLFDLQHLIAELKSNLIVEAKTSVAESKVRIEAQKVYTDMLKQKSKVERVFEMIKIAKIRARMQEEEIRAN